MEKESDLVLKTLTPKGDFKRAITDLHKEGYKYLYLVSVQGAEIIEQRKDYELAKLSNGYVGLIYEGNSYAHVYTKELIKQHSCSPDKYKQGDGCDCDDNCPEKQK